MLCYKIGGFPLSHHTLAAVESSYPPCMPTVGASMLVSAPSPVKHSSTLAGIADTTQDGYFHFKKLRWAHEWSFAMLQTRSFAMMVATCESIDICMVMLTGHETNC